VLSIVRDGGGALEALALGLRVALAVWAVVFAATSRAQ
jgi:hypothetical protein